MQLQYIQITYIQACFANGRIHKRNQVRGSLSPSTNLFERYLPCHSNRTRYVLVHPEIASIEIWKTTLGVPPGAAPAARRSSSIRGRNRRSEARANPLRRITIAPTAHGSLFLTLYQTPMICSLPYGFNYPIPRGWPTVNDTKPEPEGPAGIIQAKRRKTSG